jgi:hypothetical protein
MTQHTWYADAAERTAGGHGVTYALLAIYHLLDARLPRQNPLDQPVGPVRPPQPREPSSNQTDTQKETS